MLRSQKLFIISTDTKKYFKNHMSNQLSEEIISSPNHPLSPDMISDNAKTVTSTLKKAGFEAYVVGGSVRDGFLGKRPKDFDVTTNATPEEVKALFTRNARIIGKRFRIVHVTFGFQTPKQEIIEVATFRSSADKSEEEVTVIKEENLSSTKISGTQLKNTHGMLIRDNVYGSLEDDAMRRDFTINSLYYDVEKNQIHDFHHGIKDLEENRIDIIGDPKTRYHEDPVRMLRAIRFASKLNMQITQRTAEPIYQMGHLLREVSNARMYDEMIKMMLMGYAKSTFNMMQQFNLIRYIFPSLDTILNSAEGKKYFKFLSRVFVGTDERMRENHKPNPKFLFACLLWPVLETTMLQRYPDPIHEPWSKFKIGLSRCAKAILMQQQKMTAPPNFIFEDIKKLWDLQMMMYHCDAPTAHILAESFYFKASLDFLEYRASADSRLVTIFRWWQELANRNPKLLQPRTRRQEGNIKPKRKRKSGGKSF